MTIDMASVIQVVIGAAMIGFGADHFRLRGEVSRMQAAFVTWEHMKRFEDKIDIHFTALRTELQRLGEHVAELRGRSGG